MKYNLHLELIKSYRQGQFYEDKAAAAYKQMTPAFFDYRHIAIGALAEYMANLNGWTFFEDSVGKEYKVP